MSAVRVDADRASEWQSAMLASGSRPDTLARPWPASATGEIDYDSKNLMHTIRLLLSGESILTRGCPIVRFQGTQRELLLQVRAGALSYAEVMAMAEEIRARCIELRPRADLPEQVDPGTVDRVLAELTRQWGERNR